MQRRAAFLQSSDEPIEGVSSDEPIEGVSSDEPIEEYIGGVSIRLGEAFLKVDFVKIA
jgi:hypothetical protein